MATTTSMPEPEPQTSIGTIGRLTGALFSPKRTFADIAAKPSWVAPLLLLAIIWIGLNAVLVQRTDWMEVSRQQIEKNKFAARAFEQMKPEDRDIAYQKAVQRAKITRYVRGVIGWPLLVVIMSGIYLGAFKLIGGARINYVTALAVVAYAHLPMGIRELLAIPVNLIKDGSAIDPENFLASNVASFLGGDAPLWQTVLGGSVDIFGIWALILVAIGFSAVDPKKVKPGTAFGIVFGFWATITLFFTGLTSFLS